MTDRLYYVGGSPFARMARVLIAEWGLPITRVEIAFPPPPEFFDISPLGQVPVLHRRRRSIFPTLPILLELASLSRLSQMPDLQTLEVALHALDALAAARYQDWAGLTITGRDSLGFNPRDRNLERVQRVLDWIDPRIRPDQVGLAEVAVACMVLWADSRGPIRWNDRSNIAECVEFLRKRPSFRSTEPPEWTP